MRRASDSSGVQASGRTALLLCLACAVMALGLVACAALTQKLEPPRVSVSGLEPEEFGLFEQRYLLRLRVQNPNDVELPVAGMDFRLYLNDEEFASGVSDQQLTVPAYGEQLVEVRVTSSLAGIIEQLRRMTQTESQTFRYRLAGHVKLLHRSVKYPFEHSGEIDLTETQD